MHGGALCPGVTVTVLLSDQTGLALCIASDLVSSQETTGGYDKCDLILTFEGLCLMAVVVCEGVKCDSKGTKAGSTKESGGEGPQFGAEVCPGEVADKSKETGVEAAEALRLYTGHLSGVHHTTTLLEASLNSVCHDGTCHGSCATLLVGAFQIVVNTTVHICEVGPGDEAKCCTTSGIHVSLVGHHDVRHGLV